MITDEIIKEFNLTEFKLHHPQYSKPYNCLLLADKEKGFSFKPYPIDDEEKAEIIEELRKLGWNDYEGEAEDRYNSPEYCFAVISYIDSIDFIRDTIKNGKFPSDIIWNNRTATCPFA